MRHVPAALNLEKEIKRQEIKRQEIKRHETRSTSVFEQNKTWLQTKAAYILCRNSVKLTTVDLK